MRLLGRDKLNDLSEVKWLTAWVAEVNHARWGGPDDLLSQFPKACDIGEGQYRFKFGDTEQVIDLLISFPHKTALITNISM